jgi:hypothetical protein
MSSHYGLTPQFFQNCREQGALRSPLTPSVFTAVTSNSGKNENPRRRSFRGHGGPRPHYCPLRAAPAPKRGLRRLRPPRSAIAPGDLRPLPLKRGHGGRCRRCPGRRLKGDMPAGAWKNGKPALTKRETAHRSTPFDLILIETTATKIWVSLTTNRPNRANTGGQARPKKSEVGAWRGENGKSAKFFFVQKKGCFFRPKNSNRYK